MGYEEAGIKIKWITIFSKIENCLGEVYYLI